LELVQQSASWPNSTFLSEPAFGGEEDVGSGVALGEIDYFNLLEAAIPE
jgi:hypothetical protein